MKPVKNAPDNDTFELSLFCGIVGDAWRVHVWPNWLPGFLRHSFDEKGEAFPVYLDLEELDRQMEGCGVQYTKIHSPIGGYELTASGRAATVLAVWLSQSLLSGKRSKASADGDPSSNESSGMVS